MGGQSTALLAQLLDCLWLVERELLLFASFWFVIGAIDEAVVDAVWAWLRLTRRLRERRLTRNFEVRPLAGRAAVLVAA